MAEKDYQVFSNGEKIPHDDPLIVKHSGEIVTAEVVTPKLELEPEQTTESNNQILVQKDERTTCEICNKEMKKVCLKRHVAQQHGEKKFSCGLCKEKKQFRRIDHLESHMRNIHYEKMTMGRPKKMEIKRRSRSPFQREAFKRRHGNGLENQTEPGTEADKKTVEYLMQKVESIEQKLASKEKELQNAYQQLQELKKN